MEEGYVINSAYFWYAFCHFWSELPFLVHLCLIFGTSTHFWYASVSFLVHLCLIFGTPLSHLCLIFGTPLSHFWYVDPFLVHLCLIFGTFFLLGPTWSSSGESSQNQSVRRAQTRGCTSSYILLYCKTINYYQW